MILSEKWNFCLCKNEKDSITIRQKSQAIKSIQFAFIAGDLMKSSCEHSCASEGLWLFPGTLLMHLILFSSPFMSTKPMVTLTRFNNRCYNWSVEECWSLTQIWDVVTKVGSRESPWWSSEGGKTTLFHFEPFMVNSKPFFHWTKCCHNFHCINL